MTAVGATRGMSCDYLTAVDRLRRRGVTVSGRNTAGVVMLSSLQHRRLPLHVECVHVHARAPKGLFTAHYLQLNRLELT